MKKFVAFALILLAAITPAVVSAQAAASFTGKWQGTFIMTRPDGTTGNPNNFELNLTQKAAVLTGTGGPAEQQWAIAKGAVKAGKATFDVQQPNGGPLFKFALTIVKGRLAGEVTAVGADGAVRATGKVDAGKAAAAKK
jgi:hypothetical protein